MATPSEQSPCSSKASKGTEKICPAKAGRIKGENKQSVLIEVFKAVFWGAAKFSDMQLRQGELFLCLAPGGCWGKSGGKRHPQVCYHLWERENISCGLCLKIDFFALKPVCKI